MDLCSAGAAEVVNASSQYGLPRAACIRIVNEDAASTNETGEDLGLVPIACALGVTALNAPADANGSAELIYENDVGGFPAIAVGGFDARAREVAGQLSPGDTCLHGTHSDSTKRAKVFCKENHLSLLIGNDTTIVIDRADESLKINLFGQSFEMSSANGILMTGDGGAYIQIKGGSINIVGNVAFGNKNPASSGPVVVMVGAVPSASTSVFTNG